MFVNSFSGLSANAPLIGSSPSGQGASGTSVGKPEIALVQGETFVSGTPSEFPVLRREMLHGDDAPETLAQIGLYENRESPVEEKKTVQPPSRQILGTTAVEEWNISGSPAQAESLASLNLYGGKDPQAEALYSLDLYGGKDPFEGWETNDSLRKLRDETKQLCAEERRIFCAPRDPGISLYDFNLYSK